MPSLSPTGMVILMDTREQRPLEFPLDHILTGVERVALPVGDYACRYVDGRMSPVVFERKSLSDLFGTMTSGYPRFRRELLRARERGVLLCLGIEASLSKVYQGSPQSDFSGASCVQKLFTLWMKYGCQPVFCRSREELAAFMRETFEAIGRTQQMRRMDDPIQASSS